LEAQSGTATELIGKTTLQLATYFQLKKGNGNPDRAGP
jgi:hypothetical protein